MTKETRFDLPKIIKHARELRKEMTEAEKTLWKELRGRRIGGYKFLRQHPILYHGKLIRYNYFIANFYCHAKKVIIELDGPIHEQNKEYDKFRDSIMEELKIKTLRIKNEELADVEYVINKIEIFLDSIS